VALIPLAPACLVKLNKLNRPADVGNLFSRERLCCSPFTAVFGNNQNQQQQQQQPQQPAGGLFGNAGGGGLFGQNQQNQAQQQQTNAFGSGGGLFGAKPAAPSLFGGSTGTTGGGLFGQNNTNAAGPQQPGGSLFGSTLGQSSNQPAQTSMFGGGGGGLFGSKPAAPSLQPTQSAGGSLFGNTLTTSQLGPSTSGTPQGTLQPSISQPVSLNLPIFSMLPTSSINGNINRDQSTKKKTNLFEPMVKTPAPRAVMMYSSTKARGYASTSRSGTPNGFSLTSGKQNVLNFSVSASRVGPDGFTPSAVLGSSSSKASVKKLILDKKVDASDVLRRSSASPGPGKVVFNPALSVAAREREDAVAPQLPAPTPARRGGGRFLGATASESTLDGDADGRVPQDGDYWCKPNIVELSKLGHDELAGVRGLVVGRVGFGQIEFLEPVDLTTLPKLSALLGEVIRFDKMECSVYPDSDEVDKPPPGAGLNARARIALTQCWPLDKATRQPITDHEHPQVLKHLKRLEHMPDTTFEDFNLEEGKWVFVVEHF
jgi:nuclear pore complex protein Nup98-Nup96